MKPTAFAAPPNPASPPRLYSRQRCLLALLHELGGHVGNTDFQKLLFLHCQEDYDERDLASADPPYEFVPYKYGAFSFTCYADRRRLIAFGLLTPHESVWGLTESGKRVATDAERPEVSAFVTRHRDKRGDALIANTYRAYPYYAIRSERAEYLLKHDLSALQEIQLQKPMPRRGQLFTLGYEGRSLENYLNILIRAGVTLLCDIRQNPLSRKYGFSRKTLSHACENIGIRYVHIPELGISSERRRGISSTAEYTALFRYYRQHVLSRQKDKLRNILAWLRQGESVALTCYEGDAGMCHRSHTAAAIVSTQRSQRGLWRTTSMADRCDQQLLELVHLR